MALCTAHFPMSQPKLPGLEMERQKAGPSITRLSNNLTRRCVKNSRIQAVCESSCNSFKTMNPANGYGKEGRNNRAAEQCTKLLTNPPVMKRFRKPGLMLTLYSELMAPSHCVSGRSQL